MLSLRALSGPQLGPADFHSILTLLLFARPQRVREIGAVSGHLTANLTEWTDDESVIISDVSSTDTLVDHFGKAGKVRRLNSQEQAFDLVVIHPSADVPKLHQATIGAFQSLAPGGWLVWLGFHPEDETSAVYQAVGGAGLPDPVFHFAGTAVASLQKSPAVPRPKKGLSIRWEGDVDVIHSLATVNRALIDRLQTRGHNVSVQQGHSVPAASMTEPHPAHFAIDRQLPGPPDVVIRHAWPPDLTPAADGKPVVLIQPWEYGSPPAAWVEALRRGDLAEWWVPSGFIRNAAIASGAPAERIAVVPNGVDGTLFRPQGDTLPLRTRKRFKFLFVGGTIWRKGFDVLLAAYGEAFSASDDVSLIVKDTGVGTYYRGQTADQAIRDFANRPGAPELEYHTEDLTDLQMAQLFRSVDCLVHPYRGEGFGLPVAEAMACGLAVLVTQGGATDDWCDDCYAYRIPARRVELPPGPVSGFETLGKAWYLEPDRVSLVTLFRTIVAHPDEVRAKGIIAAESVRERLTWDQAARVMETRIRALIAKPRISLTMIVRNEEENLPQCLASARGLFDEIVIVDTGSSDRTREIARSFGARVVDSLWADSFAEARNRAIEQATGDWIFWLDADDRIDAANSSRLRALFDSLGNEQAAFVMTCLCLGEPGGPDGVTDHLRLFRRHPDLRWRYRVHEQILPALQSAGMAIHRADIVITHVGYTDAELVQRKLERDARLLQRENLERPDDPLVLFQLGANAHKRRDPVAAFGWFRQSLSLANPGDSFVAKCHVLLAQCLRETNLLAVSLEVVEIGRSRFPDDAELLFLEATLRQELNDTTAAEACYRQLLVGPQHDGLTIGNHVAGLRGYLSRHGLARLLAEVGRLPEAIALWQQVLEERPDFEPAREGHDAAIRIRG